MYCATCGHELAPQGTCPVCPRPGPSPNMPVAAGDAFLHTTQEIQPPAWKAPVFGVLSFIFFLFILLINYVRTLRKVGAMNSYPTGYQIGYLIGGCLGAYLVGVLIVFVIEKVRREKFISASKFLGISGIAFFWTLLALGGSLVRPAGSLTPDTNHEVGTLLKEAAGRKPQAADAHWWDGPSRDFFHDILERNQQYSQEVSTLDSSAIKDLYSVDSYAGETHMQKVLAQLHAALAVDEKYGSLDAVIKRMEERVAAADAPENEKESFLTGMKNSMEKSLGPRNEVLRTEDIWMNLTIELYEFCLAHTADYSIRDGKLYFKDTSVKDEFTSLQSKAIEAHHEFLKAQKIFAESQKNGLNQMGVSPSDLTPSQPAK
jgi:hypothetical protein